MLVVPKKSGTIYDTTGTVEFKYKEGQEKDLPDFIGKQLIQSGVAVEPEKVEEKAVEPEKVEEATEELLTYSREARQKELKDMNRKEQNAICKALGMKGYTKPDEDQLIQLILDEEEKQASLSKEGE